ncbi:hypothetical protein [Cecembia calidifontis]|jgi:hypothetical protein|uniref:Fimbrillin-A associated anchor protein Mfa1/Mfa2 n=1 Tax=Cecembia calidifontis TaxID=1187080 RepID=A0A4Q7P6N4_9BACT|nr:hypothetical protein [Cecembia calidifontis]RZS95743.1 hypothetical protein BC751_1284 [Cecembia calidifontis]
MKKLLACIMLFGSMAYATASEERKSEVPVSLKKVEENKVLFRFKGTPEGPVTVRIYDENNTLVKRHRVFYNNAFAKVYNFNQIGPGNYTMEIMNGQNLVDRLSINLESPVKKPTHFITSNLEPMRDNAFRLSVNSEIPEDITVSIFKDGALLHEEKLDNVSGLNKIYRMQGISMLSRIDFYINTESGYTERIIAR